MMKPDTQVETLELTGVEKLVWEAFTAAIRRGTPVAEARAEALFALAQAGITPLVEYRR